MSEAPFAGEQPDAPPGSSTQRVGGGRAALAVTFLRLGLTAFGGPAAHIALMEQEFVRRRRWLTAHDFLDLVGAASLIPGPSSTEVAIYIGYRRAGLVGLALAGTCFILPAALIVSGLAWAYVHYGQLPTASGLLRGVEPVVVAIIAQALWTFGRTAIKTPLLAALGLSSFVLDVLGVSPLVLLAIAGAVGMAARAKRSPDLRAAIVPALPWAAGAVGTAMSASPSLTSLFLVFLKAGSVVFGSGYVLLAFLRGDLVDRLRWLTEAQLVDAVAVGQVTPGPVFTTATFIGYVLHGAAGAFVATVGIFLPSFILVAVTAPFIPRLRRSRIASGFLDGVNVASLGLMAAVSIQLARTAVVDALSAAIALVSLALLVRFRINSTWLIAGGALIGIAVAG
jgi:chromate transporter